MRLLKERNEDSPFTYIALLSTPSWEAGMPKWTWIIEGERERGPQGGSGMEGAGKYPIRVEAIVSKNPEDG